MKLSTSSQILKKIPTADFKFDIFWEHLNNTPGTYVVLGELVGNHWDGIIVPILRHFGKLNFTYYGKLSQPHYSYRSSTPEQTRVPQQTTLIFQKIYFNRWPPASFISIAKVGGQTLYVYFGSSTSAIVLFILLQLKQTSRSRHLMFTLVYFALSTSAPNLKTKRQQKGMILPSRNHCRRRLKIFNFKD